jgi:hypothetical protein
MAARLATLTRRRAGRVTGSERDEIIAAINRQFETLRHVYVATPQAGGDSVDAAIGSALNDAEGRVLAVLHAYDPSPATRHRQQPAPGSAVRTD